MSPPAIGVIRAGQRSAAQVAAWSRGALDRPLGHDAELWIAIARDDALLLGAFQRGAGMPDDAPLFRRGSGGPRVRVTPRTLHVALSLAHPGALFACDEKRIVNRYVRPLLRTLTRAGALAHYFGRDSVIVAHQPAAWVGYAHDATSRRTLFEAFVHVPKLESIVGREFDSPALADALALAYAPFRDPDLDPDLDPDPEDPRSDPPWLATVDEAIGPIAAGPDLSGRFRVGGDLLVSRDALSALQARLPSTSDSDVGRLVDETLAAPGVALDGVRSLASVRDVILAARAAYGKRT